MNAVPGFERAEDKPKTPWLTMTVVGLLTALMAAGLILRFMQSIEWPAEWWVKTIATPSASVENYTLFEVVKLDQGEVHTGYVFTRSCDPAPSHQYCYVQMRRKGSRASNHLTLAGKKPGRPVQYRSITGEEAAALGLPRETANELGRRHCRFRHEGGW